MKTSSVHFFFGFNIEYHLEIPNPFEKKIKKKKNKKKKNGFDSWRENLWKRRERKKSN